MTTTRLWSPAVPKHGALPHLRFARGATALLLAGAAAYTPAHAFLNVGVGQEGVRVNVNALGLAGVNVGVGRGGVGVGVGAPGVNVGVGVRAPQPNFYGRVPVQAEAPQPMVVYPEPVVVEESPWAWRRQPIYLRVPPEHYESWDRHCGYYRACSQPVFFVREEPRHRWYGRHHGWHRD